MNPIVINGTGLCDNITGIPRYVYETVVRLDKLIEGTGLDVRIAYRDDGRPIHLPELKNIRLVPLNARDKEVSRVKNASRLRVEFTLAGNDLAEPGERTVYVRITSPDGYVQSNASAATFEFEGERLTYTASRDVDYQNEDLAVGVYYNDGAGFTAGTYRVEVYADGRLAGQSDSVLR